VSTSKPVSGHEGVEIAGSDVVALDAEVTAYVSALITRVCNIDERVERRLEEIHTVLEKQQAAGILRCEPQLRA
jgi:uncharacterized protein (DUF362 family)